jgi:hypothetical protein
MAYVSCQYAPPDPLQAEPKPAGQKAITCTDEQGQVWFLSEDSQVGDWLRYKESGGQVLAYEEPAAASNKEKKRGQGKSR